MTKQIRSRADIVSYLSTDTHERAARTPGDGNDYFPFCFNVKLRSLNFSFDHLLSTYRNSITEDKRYDDPARREQARQMFHARYENEAAQTELYNLGVEQARFPYEQNIENFDERGNSRRVQWAFRGRSGGWLVLEKFEGIDLRNTDRHGIMEWDYKTLFKLYRFILKYEVKLQGHEPERDVEFHAAVEVFGQPDEETYTYRRTMHDHGKGVGVGSQNIYRIGSDGSVAWRALEGSLDWQSVGGREQLEKDKVTPGLVVPCDEGGGLWPA